MKNPFLKPLATAAALAATVGLTSVIAADDDDKAAPKHKIETIMKKGMKGDDSIVKKIISGSASDEEKALFVEYCESLSAYKPDKGSAESWKEKTASLIKAAKSGDAAAIKKASNCKSCHTAHKPKKN